MFYAKALEIYTHAYQELNEIDEDESIDQLHESLKFSTPQIGAAGSSSSPFMYGGSAPALMTSPQAQHHPSSSSAHHQMQSAVSNPQLERTF